MHNNSYENEFNLHVNEISFSYERMSTKTRFEKEAKGNSEMSYCHRYFFTWERLLITKSGWRTRTPVYRWERWFNGVI